MFNAKRMMLGTVVGVAVLAGPALADGFSIGFSYRSGGDYYYDDCGPAVVYREAPVVVYRECAPVVYAPAPRVVYSSYAYCGPSVVYRSYYPRGYCAPRPVPYVAHGGYYGHPKPYYYRSTGGYVRGGVRVYR